MSGSFSLTEKLAVAAAFCAVVAMGVGTEEEPGVVAAATPQLASKPEAVAPVTQPAQASTSWWPEFGGGVSRGAREAAEADRRGSIGVEQAPEPPPHAF